MTRIAAVFPGQGSQSVGMLAALADAWPQVGTTFQEASDALGYDLWALARDNPDDRLNQTEYTQPVMLTADVAVARVWQAAGGPAPACVAGHSLGEYAALVAAGIVDFVDAVRLVAQRARLMRDAVAAGEGGMAALIGLDDDTVASICASAGAGRVVEPVNYNAPGQVVIAGHADAVRRAVEAAQAAGARRAIELAVSVPAHSSLMKVAAEELGRALDGTTLHAPAIPVVHNVDAATHDTVEDIRETLRRHLYNPVRWTESVRALRGIGADILVELGPGRVLAGLARRVERDLPAMAVEDPTSLAKALDSCTTED